MRNGYAGQGFRAPFGGSPCRTDGTRFEQNARRGNRSSAAPQRGRSRVAIALAALALTGCATTRYAPTYCLTRAQYEQLKAQQPPKVHDQLTGNADRDTQILAGSLIRVRAVNDGLLTILGGCVDPDSKVTTGSRA
jgi:hypothetical protein